MMRRSRWWWSALCAAVLAPGAAPARATTVQDLVRIKGHERNVLAGMGIVIGLDGTGDTSDDSFVAARPYSQLLGNLGNPVAGLEELAAADAYAIVKVTLEVPATGAREGDRFDVSVETLFNATSLAGGRLVVSMLRLPRPDHPDLLPMAFAEGPIVIEGANPRSGMTRDGGQMLVDIRTNPVTPAGVMTLVLFIILFVLMYRIIDSEEILYRFALAHVVGCAYYGYLAYSVASGCSFVPCNLTR